jgi:transposase InsO family protein
LKTKDEVTRKVKEFLLLEPHRAQKSVVFFRSDNGGEFRAQNLRDFLTDQRITLEEIPAYTPENNGLAERAIRTLLDKTRVLLTEANLPVCLWPYALLHSTDLYNLLPHKSLDYKSPLE